MNVLRFPLVLATAVAREAPFIHLSNTLESSYNAVSIQSKLAEKFISRLRDLICRRSNFAADSISYLESFAQSIVSPFATLKYQYRKLSRYSR